MYILAFFFMFIKADIDKDNVTPIDLIHLKGMTYTNSRTKKPQSRPGPGIIIELIQPFLGSKVNINNTAYNTAVLFVDNLLVF